MPDRKMKATELLQHGNPAQALLLLQRRCSQEPEDADTWLMLGQTHMAMNQLALAENCLRKSLAIKPDSASARQQLGDLLAIKEDYRQAIEHYTKSLELNPDQARVCLNLGSCLQKERRIEEARKYYLLATKIDPQQTLAYTNLGLLLEQMHKTKEARQYAELALQSNPGAIEAHILLAKLDCRDDQLESAQERLESLLEKKLTAYQRASVLMEMGVLRDRSAEYNNAFKYLTEAKRIFRSLYGVSDETLASSRETIKFRKTFTYDHTRHWKSGTFRTLPSTLVFLVGFPRSGTTLIEQILASHQDVTTTRELPILADMVQKIGEILGREFYYPEDTHNLLPHEIEILRKHYWEKTLKALDSENGPPPCLVDKFPLNIVHLGLIARLFPESRVIVALRDPRDVCLSCFMQHFEMNPAMAHFLSLNNTAEYYSEVMGLWMHYRKNISLDTMESRYEDMVGDLEDKSRQLLDFIGVNWDPVVLKFNESARKHLVHTPSYQGVIKPVYGSSIGRWKNYYQYIELITPQLKPCLQEFGYSNNI